jgi:hypothetical protein
VVLIAMGRGTKNMSQLSRGIFAAIAVSLTLGAVPLALGNDLSAGPQVSAGPQIDHKQGTLSSAVNRTAKVDRGAAAARSDAPTRTISLQLTGLSETSVLVRIPVAEAARSRSPASTPVKFKSGDRKATVACEPMVSVLTEVAKLLQPGRCVT